MALPMQALSTHAMPRPSLPPSESSHFSRRRCDGRVQLMTSLILISLTLLCNSIYCCDALSITRGIVPRHYGHDRIFATRSTSLTNILATRKGNRNSFTELPLLRRSDYSSKEESSETASLESKYPLGQESRRPRGRRRQQLAQFVGSLRRRISLIKEHAYDDTFNTDRSGYATTSAIGATSNQSNRGSKRLQTNPMSSFSTAARLSRVQSLASSPLAASSSARSSSTSLHMVLSTPDTIIEQASTQKLLDTLLDESVRTQSRQPIMLQFNPRRSWIWRQWRGTVFSETWKSCLMNMALATFVVFLYGLYPNMKDLLQGFSVLWGQLLSVTTFTLTFFLNQSYGLWRKCYDYSRRLQGRLNDLGMTLAAHATRTRPSNPDVPSTYTPQSRQALELVSRYVRVFNLLTYASFTRSHRPILTPMGMRRLVERGILTPKEREILSEAEVPATQRHNAVLVWLIRLFLEGRQAGVFEGGMGFEQQFMEKCHVIRAQYGAIGDELQGRMPLAYAHIVQVLLDVVLWMYPFMALSTGMAWHLSIVGTGLLTMFYQGLFDLAKQFLDPYDNENYGKGDDPLVIDTLIAETNAGSVRWMNSFQQQPWNRQLLNDGEMYDQILPLRGYSVEDLAEMEAQEELERQERELVIKEKKRKEEEKNRLKAEQLLMGHLANVENGTSTVVGEKGNGTAVLTPEGEVLMNSDVEGKTFMEVSGGEVVTTSSLLPSGIADTKEETNADLEPLGEVVEMESNKVLTLADGTLVTSDDTLTMNTTKSNETATQASEEDEMISDDVPVAAEDELAAVDAPPPLLDAANVVAWDQFGTTPNFDESIAEMEIYKTLPESFKASPPVPLYDIKNDIAYDENLSDEDREDDDIFQPMPIEWFHEVGPDGQEYRLSQMLADEEWSYEDENEIDMEGTIMTYEDFQEKATEIIEQVENELAETEEIMRVSPGNEAEYDVTDRDSSSSLSPASIPMTRRKVMMDEPEPLYDQTRLDAISQLWGAPPDVLERTMFEEDDDSEQTIINEGIDFRGVYSLWGEDLPSETESLDDEERNVSPPSMDGFSQLWNANLSPYERNGVDDIQDESDDPVGQNERAIDYQAYAGFEWWDEVSEDGKEVRLSQMLADEEYYEETLEEEEETPMTFEQFAEETEKLIEQAEDERKETEAIMNAPPNANFLDDDEASPEENFSDVAASIAASEKFGEMVQSLVAEGGDESASEMVQSLVVEGGSDEGARDKNFEEMMQSMVVDGGDDEGGDDAANEIVSDQDIDVLEMDDFPEEAEEEIDSSQPPVDDDEKVSDGSILQSALESEENVEPTNGDNDLF